MAVVDQVTKNRRPSPPGGLRLDLGLGPSSRLMTPQQFIALSAEERARVVRVEAVPPRIGGRGFGLVRVFTR